jgi:hypothetical protein
MPLSKSKFKTGLHCKNQLFYSLFPDKYANAKNEDPFLLQLAKGGFQVEALARAYYPEGKINTASFREYQKSFDFTQKELKEENTVIFEAGFLIDGYFALSDIVVKNGNKLELIEVKAKSYHPQDEEEFTTKKGLIKPGWKDYLFDLAFQKELASRCFPTLEITAHLLLADKSKVASVSELNQKFRLPAGKDADVRRDLVKRYESAEQLGVKVLSIPEGIDQLVEEIRNGKQLSPSGKTFSVCMDELLMIFENPKFQYIETSLTTCKSCPFYASQEQIDQGLLDGRNECMKTRFNLSETDLKEPNIFEIWDLRNANKLAEEDKFLLKKLNEADLKLNADPNKISRTERQWIQVEKRLQEDSKPYIDQENLLEEMKQWKFPLHFIDFETSMAALPFVSGMRPYEQTAFQFSHHVLHESGQIVHHSEFLLAEPGIFPNFEFVRQLKRALENDHGSIFRYHNHEKTVLNQIKTQLAGSNETDRFELIEFIDFIANGEPNDERMMVDLARVIRDYYYDPATKGSNSLKAYLPAILSSSQFLKLKYTNPIGEINVSSLNFDSDWRWINIENGVVQDPYKRLEPVFLNWNEEQLNAAVSENDAINNGGAAMVAFATLQFREITKDERSALRKKLLQYCELDTLAMVMLYEGLKDLMTK